MWQEHGVRTSAEFAKELKQPAKKSASPLRKLALRKRNIVQQHLRPSGHFMYSQV
jgi:hypothetical protein